MLENFKTWAVSDDKLMIDVNEGTQFCAQTHG